MVIFYTNPFWVSILAYFMLKEKISRLEKIGMVLCFFGVVTIALSK